MRSQHCNLGKYVPLLLLLLPPLLLILLFLIDVFFVSLDALKSSLLSKFPFVLDYSFALLFHFVFANIVTDKMVLWSDSDVALFV